MGAKGTVQEERVFSDFKRHVGLVEINKIVALNPTISERNKLYGKEDGDDDKEIEYVSETDEGDAKLHLDFYYTTTNEELGVKRHRITLIDREKKNKDGNKVQVINQLGNTSWVPLMEDGKPDVSVLLDWFTQFTEKDTGKVLGKKDVRVAIEGEELLFTFLRALFKFNMSHPDADIRYDYKKMFKGNVKELKNDVFNEEITKPFIGLLMVETSEDGEKQYEKLFGKAFFKGGMMKFINNGAKFASDWDKKEWKRFTEAITGEYGAKGFYILEQAREYNKEDDLAASNTTKKEVEADSSDY